jgi:hypothetical protein
VPLSRMHAVLHFLPLLLLVLVAPDHPCLPWVTPEVLPRWDVECPRWAWLVLLSRSWAVVAPHRWGEASEMFKLLPSCWVTMKNNAKDKEEGEDSQTSSAKVAAAISSGARARARRFGGVRGLLRVDFIINGVVCPLPIFFFWWFFSGVAE